MCRVFRASPADAVVMRVFLHHPRASEREIEIYDLKSRPASSVSLATRPAFESPAMVW